MRAKLILLCLKMLLGCCALNGEAQVASSDYVSVSLVFPIWRTESELRKWAAANPEVISEEIVSIDQNGCRLRIIPIVSGSGVWRTTLYIYGFDRSTQMWRPKGVFFTDTSSVKIKVRKHPFTMFVIRI